MIGHSEYIKEIKLNRFTYKMKCGCLPIGIDLIYKQVYTQ